MNTVAEIKDILKVRLSKKRYTHSINVADSAMKIAEKYGYDKDRAYFAGLIHDICKEIPHEEQLAMVRKSDREIGDVELLVPALYHAPAGAYYAEHVLMIHDDDILNAVRYHTIGRKDMSDIEKAVYLADLISADRNYKDVDRMRKLTFTDVDTAVFEALKFSVSDVVAKGSLLPKHTTDAYNFYAQKMRNQPKG